MRHDDLDLPIPYSPFPAPQSPRQRLQEFLPPQRDVVPLQALEQRLAGYAAATSDAPQRGIGRVSSEPLVNVRVQGRQLNALLSESAAELVDTRHVRVLAYHFGTSDTR